MPMAREGKSIGSVMMTAKAPFPRMAVRQNTHEIVRAKARDSNMAMSDMVRELKHAGPNCGEEKMPHAFGSARFPRSPKSGRMAAKRKNSARTTRVRQVYVTDAICAYVMVKEQTVIYR